MTWVDLDPFYAKVKLVTYAFVWEKVKIIFFFLELIAALGLKVA